LASFAAAESRPKELKDEPRWASYVRALVDLSLAPRAAELLAD
jgi:hypothetical protein